MSLIHSLATGKSNLINLVDTPGHVNLMDTSRFGHLVGGWYVIGCGTSSQVSSRAVLYTITLVTNKIDHQIPKLKIRQITKYY
ncbi:hypothetical protein F5877DRAFT_55072 [Lentinula edodes]|nr:hypothetical protein F5877DRAFT_55072 [Lentinula edodes]